MVNRWSRQQPTKPRPLEWLQASALTRRRQTARNRRRARGQQKTPWRRGGCPPKTPWLRWLPSFSADLEVQQPAEGTTQRAAWTLAAWHPICRAVGLSFPGPQVDRRCCLKLIPGRFRAVFSFPQPTLALGFSTWRIMLMLTIITSYYPNYRPILIRIRATSS